MIGWSDVLEKFEPRIMENIKLMENAVKNALKENFDDDIFYHFLIYLQRFVVKNPDYLFKTEKEVLSFFICIFNLALKINVDECIFNVQWFPDLTDARIEKFKPNLTMEERQNIEEIIQKEQQKLEEFNELERQILLHLGFDNLIVTNEQFEICKIFTGSVQLVVAKTTKKRKFSTVEDLLPETPETKKKFIQ